MLTRLQTTTLPNGIRVVSLAQPMLESARVAIWAKVGSRYESDELAGASHFIEHLLFKGTPKRSAIKISQAIESQGGEMNAFTGNELTCYYATVPYEKAKVAFDVLSDMYYNALFDETEMDRERAVVLEEFNLYADRPDVVSQENLEALLWEGHPIGRPILGRRQVIQSISREAIVSYRNAFYTTGATVFAFYGKVDHDQCVKWVVKATGHLPAAPLRAPEPYARVVPQGHFNLQQKAINQTHLSLGWRNLGYRDEQRPIIETMSCLMGENMSSRLFQKLREKRGLCYSIAAGNSAYADAGAWTVYAGCDPKRAFAGAKAIFNEVQLLASKAPSRAELKRTTDYLAGSLRLRLERNPLSWAVRNMLLLPTELSPAEMIAAYRAVTPQEISELAQQFTPQSASLSIVSPQHDAVSEEKWRSLIS